MMCLSPPGLPAEAALFLDVDGTLLELAPRPELVRVPAELPALLARLSRQRAGALALISGRPLAQLDRLFRPWRGAASGLHGGEWRHADGTVERAGAGEADRAAAAALDAIRPALGELQRDDGRLLLEDKGGTVALHYRAAPEREAEIRAAAEQLRRRAGQSLRVIAGKMVVEFQPAHRDKGAAVSAFLQEAPFQGRLPVFLGDDVTDEDAFAEVNRRGGHSVRIGEPAETAARYRLPSVSAALDWLGGRRGGNPQGR